MNHNLIRFQALLAGHYERLFREDPEYAYAASRNTPDMLAAKMTDGLTRGAANKDGKAIAATCKDVGIKHTYKAIREHLTVQA